MHEAFQQSLVDVQSEVRAAFEWTVASDRSSAEAMVACVQNHAAMLPVWRNAARNQTLEHLRSELLAAKEVVVLGAAVTESEVESMDMDERLIIAADGSVGALSDRSKLACVVSDFDGGVHLDGAAGQGTVMVVHAHGDNPVRWLECLNTWSQYPTPPRLILTHQTPEVLANAHNFGGFTDGDRAVCFALAMGVAKENIRLVGFALNMVGAWSATTVAERKLEKLVWMNRILSSVGLEDAVAK
ncbi:MAG: hypothetical protein OSA38_05955 [Candidatus Poseidoniaceae archaeon]|nr:hypothetical protein [Candidatus Poseidoniaceae archaeon]